MEIFAEWQLQPCSDEPFVQKPTLFIVVFIHKICLFYNLLIQLIITGVLVKQKIDIKNKYKIMCMFVIS